MTSARRRRRERGAGLIGTIAGVTVFLAFLTFAVQLLFNLYTATVVTSATYDAARLVADDETQPPDGAELRRAEDQARQTLGRVGDDATFTWDLADPDVVRLRVQARSPRFLLPVIDTRLGLDLIDRTVTVRVERVQG
jgi:Flp pilus assembly protein TadG